VATRSEGQSVPCAFPSRKIFDYLDEHNPQAARAVVGLIHRRINELGDHPHKGRRTNKPNIYMIWIAPYRYRIFYRIDGDEVVILQIRHASRRPWP
jgi:plasmid stabilization system protein ParE